MNGHIINSFCSLAFLGAFVPATALIYTLSPQRVRPWVLLLASYACFWLISGKLLVLLIATTLVTYLTGLVLGRVRAEQREAVAGTRDRAERRAIKARYRNRSRMVVGFSALASVGILVSVKYLGFLGGIASSLGTLVGFEWHFVPPKIGVPIGISFYTLQALSYVFDVYRSTIEPERNPMRLALFMGFFPQLMEGPICRYGETADQLAAGEPIRTDNLVNGLVRIAWGVAKIIIVADRLNLYVKPVFADYTAWSGTVIALGAVLYTFQLYCDFSGTIDIVIGVGRIFGVRLPENFRQPFFSRTASEFWQRWHITLGAWLRDYVFYPVSLSSPVKRFARGARKVFGTRTGSVLSGGVALFCVWILNGLWHGSGWQYLFFGMYYFVTILASGLLEPLFSGMRRALKIDPSARPWIVFQVLRTWTIVFVGELIFRAEGVRAGIGMLGRIASGFSPAALIDGSVLAPGMDAADFAVVALFAVAMLFFGLWRELGCRTPRPALQHRIGISCAALAAICVVIIVFGAYGQGYVPLDPIYAQF